MTRLILTGSFAVMLIACSPAATEPVISEVEVETVEPTALMRWPDLLARPLPKPTEEIRLGEGKSDIVDLWLPEGGGPHPVVLMVHGGCWQKGIADRTLMNYAAEDLRQRGLAVWNIEYRGVDEEGGGYPGTFQDVATAADALRDYAKQYALDIDNLAAFGHSAGGHLGVWLAARQNLPLTSPLYSDTPLAIPAVVNSGGLADLEASEPHTLESCLSSIMGKLTGPASENRPNVFSDTSPSELLPTGAEIISVNGDKDGIAPVLLGVGFTEKASDAGDEARFVQVDNSGHVELIAPGTHAFNLEAKLLEDLLK